MAIDYKAAGVDIEAGYKAVELMKKHVQGTMRPEVLTNLGGFSGAFSMERFKSMEKPTLVSGTDGVGTKLKYAFIADKHDTVGIDCVAMCAFANIKASRFYKYIPEDYHYNEYGEEIWHGGYNKSSKIYRNLVQYPYGSLKLSSDFNPCSRSEFLVRGWNIPIPSCLIWMDNLGSWWKER